MNMNDTPSGERVCIGFFGRRNAGKSSLVNAVTGQALSVVSDVLGTTTDPVKKAMELLPIGPVVILDTPGIDDSGELGEKRVEKTLEALRAVHIAVLVADAAVGLSADDEKLIAAFTAQKIPYIIAYNKIDLLPSPPKVDEKSVAVSATRGDGIRDLKEKLGALAPRVTSGRRLVADLLQPNDVVVLVTPIDAAAPKGRLILPQQQTIRDILDAGCLPLVTRETELSTALAALRTPPRMVVTDSQAFGLVHRILPREIPLTSFSILFARYKGDLDATVRGIAALDKLRDGDSVLISEGCTHHRQCGDIGTEKLPKLIRAYTKKDLRFAFTSGGEFPSDPTPYALVIHCGGCMLNEKEMQARAAICAAHGVPMSNYGIALAHLNGILPRALELFPDTKKWLEV